MPYGEGPKSSWTLRVAVGLLGVRPLMKLMYAAEFGSTGAWLMSRFHQLLSGKTCRPPSVPPSAGGSAAVTSATDVTTDARIIGTVRTGNPPLISPSVP